MRNKKIVILFLVLIAAVVAGSVIYKIKQAKPGGEVVKEEKPVIGTIENFISTTGSVLPKNRLEIKPPVSGRVESLLVKEGDLVKTGQTLAWMSSTERAALLDAARGQGEETLKYWEEAYKAIPLIAPIDAEVIVATTQPGQTVTTGDAVLVLSDMLIVRAQVDETDIGKVKLGQDAVITIDAYPDTKIKATVDHIYYESRTVNNVTIYDVDLLPETTPGFFRSGMNATVDFVEKRKEKALLVPAEAVIKENGETFVLVKEEGNGAIVRRSVKLGLSDDKNTEIISGLNANDTVVIKSKKYSLPKNQAGTNPFMPARRQAR